MNGAEITRTRLLAIAAVTALVSTRVYCALLPQGSRSSAIRVSMVAGIPETLHLRGRSSVLIDRVQLDCYAASDAADPLGDARALALAAMGDMAGGVATGLLGWCVERDRADAVRFLLEEGVDPNGSVTSLVSELPSQVGPLYLAAELGRMECSRLLLDAGAELNVADPRARITPLHAAASHGHEDLVRLFLERGADPNARDAIHSATPLGFAQYCRHEGVVALLSERT